MIPTHPSGMMEIIGDKMVDDVGAAISYKVEWTMADGFGKYTVDQACLGYRRGPPYRKRPRGNCPHLRTPYEPALPVFIKPNLAYFHRS